MLKSFNFDQSSNGYKLNNTIYDISNCRMFSQIESDISVEPLNAVFIVVLPIILIFPLSILDVKLF